MLGQGSEIVPGLSPTIIFGKSIEHLAINKALIIYADKVPG